MRVLGGPRGVLAALGPPGALEGPSGGPSGRFSRASWSSPGALLAALGALLAALGALLAALGALLACLGALLAALGALLAALGALPGGPGGPRRLQIGPGKPKKASQEAPRAIKMDQPEFEPGSSKDQIYRSYFAKNIASNPKDLQCIAKKTRLFGPFVYKIAKFIELRNYLNGA